MRILTLFFLLVIAFAGCSKNDNVERLTLLRMAQKVDPEVAPLLAKDLKSGVRCKKVDGTPIYGEGCTGAFKVKVGILDITVLEFENPDLAKKEADRLGQYYFANWVFDEVSGEPVLEHFVKKAFNAKKGRLQDSQQ